jgi:hypothetical protein
MHHGHISAIHLLIALALAVSTQVRALDHAIAQAPLDKFDKLQDYNYALLHAALVASEAKFGGFKLERSLQVMQRDRQFTQVEKGKSLTILVSPPKKEWRNKLLRVPFPIQRGVSGYRLFFVMEQNKNILASIKSLEELKMIPTGSNASWSTTSILRDHGFNVVTSQGYKTLFHMLAKGRFATLGRGLNEIPIELRLFSKEFPSLTFDEHIVLYTFLPNYYYVSPDQPQLATRLEFGLKALHASGELDRLFNIYYGHQMKRFDISSRRKFVIENTNLEAGMYEHDKPYLLNF